MTADVKLLPLPGVLPFSAAGARKALQDWCRANVAHATAAKDAEIEALKSDLGDYMDAANYQAARAERLAEALLELCNVIDGHEVPVAVEGKAAHARAALEAARDGMTSPVTPTATPPVRILIGAIESEILQLEGKATWMSQAARIASLRAAIDAAREASNG